MKSCKCVHNVRMHESYFNRKDPVKCIVLCRDSCSSRSEDGLTEDDRVDPQAGPPCIVVRVRANVPPHL